MIHCGQGGRPLRKAKKRKGHRIFLRFLAPYVIVLLIPLAIGTSTYHKTTHVLTDEEVAKNIEVLNLSREILDRRFREVDFIVSTISRASNIYNYQFVTDPFAGATTYKTRETAEEMYDFSLTNNFIYNYYVYYRQSDMVLALHSAYRFPDFYRLQYAYADMKAEEWKQTLTENYYNRKFLPSRMMTLRNKQQQMVTYLQSFGYSGVSNGVVVVLIDNAEIQNLLQRLVTSRDGWAYIADETGQIISYVAENKDDPVPIPKQADKQGMIEEELSSRKMIVTYTTSDYNRWTYVVAQPASLVWDKVNYIRRITITSIAVSLLAGIGIALYLAYRNGKPLKSIVRHALERFERDSFHSKDAYGFIEGALLRLSDNNEELEKKMQEQIPLLRHTFFERLLKGEFTSDSEMERLPEHIGVEVAGRYYTVAILHTRFEKLAKENLLERLDISRVLVKEILRSVGHERYYEHNVDEDKIAVLFISGLEDRQKYAETLQAALEQIMRLISGQLDARVTIAVGGICEQIASVSRSYEEARKVLSNSVSLNASNAVVHYEEVPQSKNACYFPADLEVRLMNVTKSGNEQQVADILQRLYRENFVERRLSLPLVRLFLYDLLATLMRTMEYLDMQDEAVERIIDTLESDPDPGQTFRSIENVFTRLCRMTEERKKSRNIRLKDQMIAYLEAVSSNPDLCLVAVADQFNMSEAYLSQFFKEQTGVNFSEYLERLRMDKAKELLMESRYSVNEISCKVGYSSTNTFGRAFKRVHGVSATSYKRSL